MGPIFGGLRVIRPLPAACCPLPSKVQHAFGHGRVCPQAAQATPTPYAVRSRHRRSVPVCDVHSTASSMDNVASPARCASHRLLALPPRAGTKHDQHHVPWLGPHSPGAWYMAARRRPRTRACVGPQMSQRAHAASREGGPAHGDSKPPAIAWRSVPPGGGAPAGRRLAGVRGPGSGPWHPRRPHDGVGETAVPLYVLAPGRGREPARLIGCACFERERLHSLTASSALWADHPSQLAAWPASIRCMCSPVGRSGSEVQEFLGSDRERSVPWPWWLAFGILAFASAAAAGASGPFTSLASRGHGRGGASCASHLKKE